MILLKTNKNILFIIYIGMGEDFGFCENFLMG